MSEILSNPGNAPFAVQVMLPSRDETKYPILTLLLSMPTPTKTSRMHSCPYIGFKQYVARCKEISFGGTTGRNQGAHWPRSLSKRVTRVFGLFLTCASVRRAGLENCNALPRQKTLQGSCRTHKGLGSTFILGWDEHERIRSAAEGAASSFTK